MTVARPAEHLVLGKVGRPHGLRGDFFVSGRDEPIPSSYGEVWIGATPEAAKAAKVVASRLQGDKLVVRCSLASNRDEAHALTGQLIFVPAKAARARKAKGTWLWAELDGVEVIAADGVRLGVVRHVYNAGASDIVEVLGDAGRRVDLPLIDDYFAIGAPIEDGRVTLKVPASTFADLWADA